jgi:hypothetical protein
MTTELFHKHSVHQRRGEHSSAYPFTALQNNNNSRYFTTFKGGAWWSFVVDVHGHLNRVYVIKKVADKSSQNGNRKRVVNAADSLQDYPQLFEQ